MQQVLDASLRPSTRKAYIHHWESFRHFCETCLETKARLPAPVGSILRFLAYLHKSKRKHSTIQNYVSALSHKHKMADVKDTPSSFPVQKFLMGLKNISPQAKRLQPITCHILLDIFTALNKLHLSHYNLILLRAIMSLLYWACLRIGEVATSVHDDHVLGLDQVQFIYGPTSGKPESLQINFRSFKHSKGNTPSIILSQQDNKFTCPVTALHQYVSIRPNLNRRALFITCLGPMVARSFVVDNLHKALKHTTHLGSLFNSHSFRVGRTTDLVLQGRSDAFIQKVGRWSSTEYRKYIHPQVISI